ncbi:MAG: hypothetical protein LBT81_05860 [Helicobacteraceae bacterium]|jgi:hypothetical protein|nr:hypothetical protein [Helicobacteraceae bacterium]
MLVIKEFEVNKDAEVPVKIVGREAGLISFILTRIGLEPVTTFSCGKEFIEYRSVGLKGDIREKVPLSDVTAVVAGLYKPFQLLIVSAVFAVLGVLNFIGSLFNGEILRALGVLIVFVLLSAVFAFLYYVGKWMIFAVRSGGDSLNCALHIKRSIIEGVDVDMTKFIDAAKILGDIVLKAKK